MNLPRWAKEYGPVIGVVTGTITLLGAVWAAARFLFATPTLSIAVTTTPLRLPYYLYQSLDRALIRDSLKLSDSSATVLRKVRGLLRDTENFTAITLTNHGTTSLNRVDLRIRFVQDLDGWAIEGDMLDRQERVALLDSLRYDYANSLIVLRSIPRLPPKATLTLYLWGDISYSPFFGDEVATAVYDGGAGEVVTERRVRGMDAFVYDNSGLLVILVLLVNVGAWHLMVDFLSKRRPPTNAGTSTDE